MELDELKNRWRQENERLPARDILAIERMLTHKTTDLVSVMQRKYEKIITIMLFSMLLMIVTFPVISDGFTYPGSAYGYAKGMFFYALLIIFYWLKFTSVLHLTLSDFLQQRMIQLLQVLEKSRKLEISFCIVFYVALLVVGRFFYGKGLEGLFTLQMLVFFSLSLFFAAAMIWFIARRHSRQINELRRYLQEYEGQG
jgi:membrane protease YdiL (CAAX protease family)